MIPQPLSQLEQKRRLLEERHAELKRDRSLLWRLIYYSYQLLSVAGLHLGGTLKGALTREQRAVYLWEESWLLERLGPGFLKDRFRPIYTNNHLFQIPFLLSLRRSLGVGKGAILSFLREALAVETILRGRWAAEEGLMEKAGMIDFSAGRIMYVLVRSIRPGRVLETGVANGASTTFILAALRANGRGELYSLDLPVTAEGKTFLPPGRPVGWLVPKEYRTLWHLQLGDTWQTLQPLLGRLKTIDIFFHDSEHSYDTMKFEYTAAWEALTPGGWLVSDDVGFNGAFLELALVKARQSWVWADRLGLAQKPLL